MMRPPQENWVITKPARISQHGIVVAQHAGAATIGAEMLAAGGNAVDAAVATALALAVLEPWMSGLGGAGFLLYGEGGSDRVALVDFSAVAAQRLNPGRFRLTGAVSPELFGWPEVEEDRNLIGYESICVPGAVDGLGLAVERFGRKSLAEVIAPALALAEAGLPIDWHTSLHIALFSAELARFDASSALYLPGGHPPAPSRGDPPRRLPLPALTRTLQRLATAGRRDFYEGELAAALVRDLGAGGSPIDGGDLAHYHASVIEPLSLDYRGVTFHAASALSGGPTFLEAMAALDRRLPGGTMGYPDADAYLAYAETLTAAFAKRTAELGHVMPPGSNTSHVSVVDRDGNMVSLTNTLLGYFGSKVVAPGTGILMNNGMMWFDPSPGAKNSIAAGARPLANMCPLLVTRGGVPWAALGACGGRAIIPAMVQLASFMVDFNMSLESAFATPRLDASGPNLLCEARLAPDIIAALSARFPLEMVENTLYPPRFAAPSAVTHNHPTGRNTGMAHILSPAAAAIIEPVS
ncbi:MAG TPA: gamma-glutamyltransferase [Stellaceae bacterium]|nr:gamma-glutamyltransferase [Stellaceae bacterium]